MEPVPYPLDGVLDLHVFAPREAADVVREYLRACREAGVLQVRIIHGKGTGVLRRRVHSVLDRLPYVSRYHLAYQDVGSWGATVAYLDPEDTPPTP
ncbi:MAG: Smr/MutS family protein [Bacteroidota bacterium]